MIDYKKNSYNCAHHAISRINEIHGAGIELTGCDTWQAAFIPLLRSIFSPINTPIDGCLVVMSQVFGGLHLGIYNQFHVEHNYNAGSSGCVIMSDMGTIRAEYLRVRFYAFNKTI